MKTKIKLRKEQNEKLKRESALIEIEKQKNANRDKMNDLVKGPTFLILSAFQFICLLGGISSAVVIWFCGPHYLISFIATFLIILFIIFLYIYFRNPIFFKNSNSKKKFMFFSLVGLPFLGFIISITIIAFAYPLLKISDYYVSVSLYYLTSLVFVYILYYFSCCKKALIESKDIATTINFSNVFISVTVLLLTIIQTIANFLIKK